MTEGLDYKQRDEEEEYMKYISITNGQMHRTKKTKHYMMETHW